MSIAQFDWFAALGGGILIGLSAMLLLAFNGRIAGITGMVGGAITFKSGEAWRWLFLGGMVAGAALYEYGLAAEPTPRADFTPWGMIIGGFIVGFGSRLGSGCTSGHGVCGLGRRSPRSVVAVATFLTTGIVTVFVIRQILGLSL
jgi:uncharacterized membrane protein YedE/YeeE